MSRDVDVKMLSNIQNNSSNYTFFVVVVVADYWAVKCIHTTEDTGGIPRCVSISESNRSCSNQYRIQNAGGLDDLFGGLAGSLVVPHVKYFREMMLYSQWDVRCAHFMVNIRKAQTESAGDRNEPVFRLIGHNLSPA